MKRFLLTILATALAFFSYGQNTFYGTTNAGGDGEGGTIFSVLSDGTNHQIEYTWDKTEFRPSAYVKFVEVGSGIFYGTTESGGRLDGGVIFKYDLNNAQYTIVHEFENSTGKGPRGSLILASNGKLYGTTGGGGSSSGGVLYEFDPSNNTYTSIHDFTNASGSTPQEGVYETGGKLFGTTLYGGSSGMGVMFEYNLANSTYSVLHHFDNTIGKQPMAAPILASNGKFYGTTTGGGANNAGAIYEYDPTGPSMVSVHEFTTTDGSYTIGRMIEVSGKLYGVSRSGGSNSGGVVFEYDLGGGVYSKKFDLSNTIGRETSGSLSYSSGNLYFLAAGGGPLNGGAIIKYEISSNSLTTLYGFKANDVLGSYGRGSLMIGSNGKLYGGTSSGGLGGNGVIFEYDTISGSYSLLKSFTNPLGESPGGGFVVGPNDNIYGITTKGGDFAEGVLYSFNHVTKAYTKLHDFQVSTGNYPLSAGTIVGNIMYGFTSLGGQNGDWNGVIYKFDLVSQTYTVLRHLQYSDGTGIRGEPVYYNGKIYGITRSGGGNGNGTIFEFDPITLAYTVKYNRQSSDGAVEAGLMVSSAGNLYGVTYNGGTYNRGTLFEYNLKTDTYTVKYHFNSEGYWPYRKLIQAANGKLYGTTNNDPSIFEYDLTNNSYTQKATFISGLSTLFESTSGTLLGLTNSNALGAIFRFDNQSNSVTETVVFNGASGRNTVIQSSIINVTNLIEDADNDGYLSDIDCDDNNAAINPGAIDVAGSGIDTNCDGQYLWYVDSDGDGFGTTTTISSANATPGAGESATSNDCNDATASINPGATDVAGSGIDANCDGNYLWYEDNDSDGYGSTATVSSTNTTAGVGESATADDCDDATASINPGATDIAGSGIDANCDGNYLWYVDADGDGYGISTTISSTNPIAGAGESTTADDCDDATASINPGATDVAGSGIDANCDGNYLWYVDADGDGIGTSTTISSTNTTPGAGESASSLDNCPSTANSSQIDNDGDGVGDVCDVCVGNDPAGDADGDGYCADLDCDDADPTVYPGAPELNDGKDNNCNGTVDEGFDADADGYSTGQGDCDDTNASINPGATDIAGIGIDANCDGQYLWYVDNDGDGYGSTTTVSSANTTAGAGESANADDCDDAVATTNPAGTDIAGSGVDANCDGNYLWYVDADGDGYGISTTISSTNATAGTGEAATSDDCDDATASINPGATDVPGSGIDTNCDGNYSWYVDADGDGYGSATTVSSTNATAGAGESAIGNDCDDAVATINPGATDVAGSGIDANCDGQYLWYVDNDGDGFGSTTTISSANATPGAGESDVATDNDDTDAALNPDANDIAGSGIDANGDGNYLWFVDADGDGYGSTIDVSSTNATAGAGESVTNTDCDDNDADVYPGAPALPDGKDNNCDGTIDKVAQTITFESLADVDDGSSTISLTATSSSSLSISYAVTGPAIVDGNTLTITGAGSVTVTASQAGDDGYLAADDMAQLFCVNPVPTIDINLDGFVAVTLTSNYATGNQWYLGTDPIDGATDQSYPVSTGGFYKVEVSIDGCVGTSESADIILTGALSESFSSELSIYPVPVTNRLNIATNNLPEGNYTLRIIDINGKTQITKQMTIGTFKQTYEVDLNNLPQGTYSVVMYHGDDVFIKKMVKQ